MPTIVAIGAHHDDVELRCGGTLAKYVKDGWKTVYVVASTTPHYSPWPDEKESGNYRSNEEIIELRKEESRKGAAALGVSEVHFFDFKSLYWYREGTLDRRFFDGHGTTVVEFRYLQEKLPGREFLVAAHRCPAALKFLCDFLRERDADIVLTHFPDDAHWEHYSTAVFVCKAVRQLSEEGRQIKLYGWEQGNMGNLTCSFTPTHYVDITGTIDIKCEALMSFVSQVPDHNPEFFSSVARSKAREYGRMAGMEYAEPFVMFQVPSVLAEDVSMPETYSPGRAKRGL